MKTTFKNWASYLSVTEAPHNIEFLQVSGEENFIPSKFKG